MEIRVLDHGLVRVVDRMGDDAAIVQAARVSYGTGTKTMREDQGLINYLMRHSHTTPFEMCEIKLHCKLPIFVARQWIRHRTASVNEYSARYSFLDNVFYIPNKVSTQSELNKQGRGIDLEDTTEIIELIENHSEESYRKYLQLIGTEEDPYVARELARIVIPTNIYTQWYWKIDLHNLFHFLKLRMDPHAQYEIREYANAISQIVREWVPMAWHAFEEYQLYAVTFSRSELAILNRRLKGESVEFENSGLGKREWSEFNTKLGV
jgi:thymidylate synthase (FAD)